MEKKISKKKERKTEKIQNKSSKKQEEEKTKEGSKKQKDEGGIKRITYLSMVYLPILSITQSAVFGMTILMNIGLENIWKEEFVP
jgi:hypothetical protein